MKTWMITAGFAVSLLAAAPAMASSRGDAAGVRPTADLPLPVAAPWNVQTRGPGGAGPDAGDVGDADSFGRSLQWLGLAAASIDLLPDCSGEDPSMACQPLAPAPAATSFEFDDLAHIALPAKAANSLLCYWFSPFLVYGFDNPTASAAVGTLSYFPSLTVENPVLATPGLIDPTTGLPFNGRLETAMTSTHRLEMPLPAGIHLDEVQRDSSVCIAGFVSRQALTDTYGLTAAQAKEFFKRPTTVRFNVRGQVQYVDSATLYFGLRIIGD